MVLDAWWFNNTQSEEEILQPDFFVPRTQIGLYAELQALRLPHALNILSQISMKI